MEFSGERLRTVRKYNKLTINKFIEEINGKYNTKLNNAMVSKWENNKVKPRYNTIHTLADFFEIPVRYIQGKIDFGSILIDLRLKSKLSIKEISKETNIPVNILVLYELERELPSENELIKLGTALNIDNLKFYLKSMGVLGPVTSEEIVDSKKQVFLSNDNMTQEQIEEFLLKQLTDLHIILNGQKDVYYKHRVLTNKERKKIIRVIEIILEEQDE